MPRSQTLFGSLDRVQFDFVRLLFPVRDTSKVVLIEMDKKTIEELGADAVFQRKTHAALIDRLDTAASITFDVPFPTAGPHGFPFAHAVARNGRVVLPVPSMKASHGHLVMPNSAELCSGVAGVGQREVTVGDYGVVTGLIPYRAAGEKTYPHIALEAIRVAQVSAVPSEPICRDVVEFDISEQALYAGDKTTGSVMLMLPDLRHIQRYSYVDVLRGRIAPQAFSGKLVFVGHSVFDAGAYRVSALDLETVTQLQLDALMAEALLDADVVSKLPTWPLAGIYAVLALLLTAICARTASWRMLGFSLAWALAILGATAMLLGQFRLWAPSGGLLVCGLFVYGVFASSRLVGTLTSLRRELSAFKRISSTVTFQHDTAGAHGPAEVALDVHADIQAVMQQLRSRQAAYVSVINLLPYPIFLEQDGRIVLWNDKASALLNGHVRLHVIGDTERDANDGPITVEAIQGLAVQHQQQAAENGVDIELDGAAHLLLCVSFAQDAQVHSASNLICLVDISSVKEAVTHDRQVLRHMAHDIRNPLTTILAMLEGDRVKELEADSEQAAQFVGELRRLVDYSLGVAREFLQLSRAEHLDARDFVPVPLVDLVYDTVDNLTAVAEQKSIALTAEGMDGEEVFALANRDMLMRALANLIDNAIKYSAAGTAIRVALERPLGQDGTIGIVVADQGIGIPESALPQLFEPFFQVSGVRDAGGVGLGLPFVKTVVERHGGTVSVQSRVGHGSVFRVSLPVVAVELG